MVFRVPGSDAAALVQVGRLSADPAVLAAVRGTSAANGANFDTLLSYAAMESGLNPAAHASTSSASGLYQFTEQTWLNAVREYGAAHGMGAEAALVTRQGGQLTVEDPAALQRILNLRNDPKISTELATEHLRSLADKLTPVLGRPPDPAETYLGHFLGAGGATQVLQALQATPNRPAADLLPAAAAANRAMFYAPNGTPLTMSQFVQNIRDRVQRTYASLGASNAGLGGGLEERQQGRRSGGWHDGLGFQLTCAPLIDAAAHVACDAGGRCSPTWTIRPIVRAGRRACRRQWSRRLAPGYDIQLG